MKAKRTLKLKRARTERAKPRSVQRVVGTLVRTLQKYRCDAMAKEKEMAKCGMYKRAIECHERANTLLNVINGIKSQMRSNADLSGVERKL